MKKNRLASEFVLKGAPKTGLFVSLTCLGFLGCGQSLSTGNKSGACKDSGKSGTTSLSLTSTAPPPLVNGMIGGFLKYNLYDGNSTGSDLRDKPYSTIKATNEPRCSLALEVAKKTDGKFKFRIYTDVLCLNNLMDGGDHPILELFSDEPEFGMGYQDVSLELPLLEKRNSFLKELEKDEALVRADFINMLVHLERAGGLRYSVDAAKKAAYCLEASSGLSDTPNPTNCLWQASFEVFDVDVPASFSEKNQKFLERLQVRSEKTKESAAKSLGDASLIALLNGRNERIISIEEMERGQRQLKLAEYVANACNDSKRKHFCNANQTKYLNLIQKHFIPNHADKIKNVIDSNFSEASILPLKTASTAAVAALVLKTKERLAEFDLVQAALEKHKQKLEVASNFLTTKIPEQEKIAFKSVPMFAVTPSKELVDLSFKFEGERMLLEYLEVSKPASLNLRAKFHKGSIISLGGLPVLAISSTTDQSGGASIMPLPSRKANAESAGSAGASATTKKDTSRQNADGC